MLSRKLSGKVSKGNPASGFVGSSAAGGVQWALMAKLLQKGHKGHSTVASNTCAGSCNYDWHLHDSNGAKRAHNMSR